MGISAADYTATAVDQGAPFKIIAVAMQKNPFAIASLSANPVNAPADLVGKRIGMAVANTPVLQALCTLNGVDINQIEIVPTQYDPAPLVSGQVDCLLCWETDLPVAMTVQGVDNSTLLGRSWLCASFANLHRHRRCDCQPPRRFDRAAEERGDGLERLCGRH